VASLNNASIRWHYSTQRAGGWPASLLRALGLQALLDKWPPEVLPLGARVGGLTAEAAAHLDLPQGLAVAQGGAGALEGGRWSDGGCSGGGGRAPGCWPPCVRCRCPLASLLPPARPPDADVGMVGLGVIRAGQLALLTGSSHLHLGVTDRM
jgi:ribulose kinase